MKTIVRGTLIFFWGIVLLLVITYPDFVFGSHGMNKLAFEILFRALGSFCSAVALVFLIPKDPNYVFGAFLLGICCAGMVGIGGAMIEMMGIFVIAIPFWAISGLSFATILHLLSYYPQTT